MNLTPHLVICLQGGRMWNSVALKALVAPDSFFSPPWICCPGLLPLAALPCPCPPLVPEAQPWQRSILWLLPYSAVCTTELSPALPALPPASFSLLITAFQGKRHLSGKSDEIGLPSPRELRGAGELILVMGILFLQKGHVFTLELLQNSLCAGWNSASV